LTNFRFIVEYDGTDFAGWQTQAGGQRTVQGSLAEALERLVGAPVVVIGSGRTDSGVHAIGQVANAQLETRLDAEGLHRGLNAVLPADVAVRRVAAVADDFDARRHAIGKRYRYRIWNHPVRSPLRARTSWWVRGQLDVDAMRKGGECVIGEHDFASFQAAGSGVRTTVRALAAVTITGSTGDAIAVEFDGSGFLRYMVRNLVGTLVEVGRGRLAPEDVARILAARDRAQAAATAPPQGLTLVAVRYGEGEQA
jgi:tRNA pseudouridine38-40 synthase